MGIKFEFANATPFIRDFVASIYDWKPIYIDGKWDIFFNGCPCGRQGDIGEAAFILNVRKHREHLIRKIYETYRIEVQKEALLNGSATLGGLARHVEKLYQSSGPLREQRAKEAETARVLRLQDAAHHLHRLGLLRILPSGDVDADRADRIYREAERQGGLPRLLPPSGGLPGRNA